MTTQSIEAKIREFESLRKTARNWRLGATVLGTLIVLGSVAIMNSAVQGLFRPGPKQELFVAQVSAGLQRDVVPEVQRVAVQTLTESRPILETEVSKLNGRLSDVTQAAMTEFETLQKNLPQRSEKVLDETFGKVVKSREEKIRAMFPDASNEQIQNVINNLIDEGHTQLASINSRLFDPYIVQMDAINSDLKRIQQIEAPHLKTEVPTWQMGLLVFDVARADLKDVEMPIIPSNKSKTGTGTASSATTSTSASPSKTATEAKVAPTSKGY